MNLDLTVNGDPRRIALCSVGPTFFRATLAEGLLRREAGALHEASALAAQSADPDDDVRGSAAYKRRSIEVQLPRTIHEAKVAAEG